MQKQRGKSFPSLLPGNIFYSYKETYYFLQNKPRFKTIYRSPPSYLQRYMKANKRSLLDVSLQLT